MSDTNLHLPAQAGSAVAAEIQHFGSKGVETGGFFLSPVDGRERISVVAFAGESGIDRRARLLQMSGRAIGRLFEWSDAEGLGIPGQFHSHMRRAFLSTTDEAHGLSVPGFVSAVVPYFADPPTSVVDWGWWRYEEGAWREGAPPGTSDGSVRVVRFDEDGVR